ncbi:ARM repeat superfamily protein [Forsythia ovata]|uniref:ARM repeat superfamily protein n=1 Tax=Forsythia ovata TaxID=205694 RepID=A0ABD1PK55_9LAMI
MELQNTVKEALSALYHHPDDAVRMQADRWLQDFQRTIDAWQVADNLLHDPSSNQETLIFCSQTLRSKVQRDFEELPSEAFRPLRDSLNTLLKSFHKGPPKVRTQISLAVAALAVHVAGEDWGDGGIINWIRDGMNSHPEFLPSFLELLRVLPEEVLNYKIAVRPDRRRQFENELASGMEMALNVLTACLNINELTEQVLEAFASWLRLRHRIPASTLASHPLVLTALSSLSADILSEASVNGTKVRRTSERPVKSWLVLDGACYQMEVGRFCNTRPASGGHYASTCTVISELIHYTAVRNLSEVASQMPLIQVIVPRVMGQKAQLLDPSKDEEDVKAIARLFADMGDAYVELIATAYGNEASIEAERSRRLQVFRSSYESLVSLVFLTSSVMLTAVADVLIDAALVLGGDATLRILYMKLVEAKYCCFEGRVVRFQAFNLCISYEEIEGSLIKASLMHLKDIWIPLKN